MATERFDHPAHARLDSITDEIASMNSLIVANVTRLPNQPELVDQLIHRCDELLRELRSVKTANASHGGDVLANREPSANSNGLQA